MTDFVDQFKKAASWTFFNNGNVVDPTRLRLTDSTPLHSSGIWRLTQNPRILLCLGSVVAAALIAQLLTPGHMRTNTLLAGLGATFAAASNQFDNILRMARRFNSPKALCFNTKPSADTPPTSPENLADALKIQNAGRISFGLNGIFAPIAMSFNDETVKLAVISYLAADSLCELVTIRHFNKVTRGEWVIEDATPPKTKPPEEPLMDRAAAALRDFLPAPRPS